MHSRLFRLDFNYTAPPGFDTRRVKDLVPSLVALKPEDHGNSTALKTAAGGKLPSRRGGRTRRQPSKTAGLRESRDISLRGFKISAEVHAAALSTVCDEATHASTLETMLLPFCCTTWNLYGVQKYSRWEKCRAVASWRQAQHFCTPGQSRQKFHYTGRRPLTRTQAVPQTTRTPRQKIKSHLRQPL